MEDILISIVCITYNHKDYIEDALNSFVSQKTNFSYEILVHDDASTDGTQDIIKSFQNKYPKLFKVIYQTDNQYSKGIRISPIMYREARGKFIALCEGDDYWIDDHKLQKQADFLLNHPEFSLSVHKSSVLDDKTKKIIDIVSPADKSKELQLEEIILGGGGFFSTNSMVFKIEGIKNLPHFYEIAPVGDYPLAINLALMGKVHFMNENMSVYRSMSRGSWSSKLSSDSSFRIDVHLRMIKMFESIDQFTQLKHTKIIQKLISENKCNILFLEKKYREAKKTSYYRNLKYRTKLLVNLSFRNKMLYLLLKNFRKKLT